VFFFLLLVLGVAFAQDRVKSSYSPVGIKEPFAKTMARMKAANNIDFLMFMKTT
jgi:hypothetical protein